MIALLTIHQYACRIFSSRAMRVAAPAYAANTDPAFWDLWAAARVPQGVFALPLRLGVVARIAVGIAAGFAAEHWQQRGARS